MRLSSATFPFILLTPHERGSSTCPRTRSTTGPTWSISSWATSRAHTCAPGNSWDLKGCRQKPNESLRDYVRCFSKKCTELPSVTHVEVINAFLEGTTCRNLVHELARSRP